MLAHADPLLLLSTLVDILALYFIIHTCGYTGPLLYYPYLWIIRIKSWHMQAVVTIRLYGYIDMNTINKGKRDEVINKFD
jgi:hypothetical protein